MKRFFFLLSCILLSAYLLSCSQPRPKICLKDGRQYCVTSDRIQVVTWDACYRRGVSCMEGQCYPYAIEELQQAIDLRSRDQRQVRAYGMHFREEYFPHRELGICYFHLGRIEDAMRQLKLSMSQTPSARAKYYLNQGRRSHLLENHLDTSPPVIRLELSGAKLSQEEYLTNQTPFQIRGTVLDDRYVASVSINQEPVFIELAEASIPFSVPVDLVHEGWNNVQVVAKDLVDRQVQQDIRVYLDRQGPLVIGHSIRLDEAGKPLTPALSPKGRGRKTLPGESGDGGSAGGQKPGQIILTAVVYDRSGIASFKLEQKEVARAGLDQLCLIEQVIPLTPGAAAIPFWTQDRAGNITQGQLSLHPDRRRKDMSRLRHTPMRPSHMASVNRLDRLASLDLLASSSSSSSLNRMAWSGSENVEDDEDIEDVEGVEENGIFFDITSPTGKELTTHYREMFLEGKIRTRKGIRKIELNGQQIFDASEIQAIVEKRMDELRRKLLEQQKDPERCVQLLKEAAQSSNLYYLNQKITLANEVTDLNLLAEDGLGNRGSRHYRIKKIPREEVLKSEQRMILALLPFETAADAPAGRSTEDSNSRLQLQSYINAKSLEAFISQSRFNLVEREKLPSLLIEKAIQAGQSGQAGGGQAGAETYRRTGQAGGETYQSDVAQKIGEMAAAEGVICGYVQRREDGTEILARFVEVKTGIIRLYHDVFTPAESRETLDTITAGLAMKFRNSFPICAGSIISRKGKTIQADFGSEKGIFPGMLYNIFEDERELIAKANIMDVKKGSSEAEITEGEGDKGMGISKIRVGYRVRTR